MLLGMLQELFSFLLIVVGLVYVLRVLVTEILLMSGYFERERRGQTFSWN